jgi:hypothetical protein
MKRITIAICTIVFLLSACNRKKSATKEMEDAAAFAISFPSPGKFHKMLARSTGTWIGEGTLQFSPDAPPINSGTSILINKMAMNGLYQISEIKGNTTPGMGKPWTGLRITGYDSDRKVFTRAMIGDGTAVSGVAMEGAWDEATKSMTMPFKRVDPSTGEERNLKEVYRIIDENTEVLEIYATDPKTKKEFKMLNVKWTRRNKTLN